MLGVIEDSREAVSYGRVVREGIMREGIGPHCFELHGYGKNLGFYSLCDETSLENFVQGNVMI